jgi:hypothetical protein
MPLASMGLDAAAIANIVNTNAKIRRNEVVNFMVVRMMMSVCVDDGTGG